MPAPLVTTTAPAFKTTLLAALQARPNLAGIQVVSTFPGDTLRPVAVYFGHTTATVVPPVMAGSRIKRQETYLVEVYIDVCDGSNDVFKAEAAAYGIMGELDECLAADATQGNAGGSAQQIIDSWIASWESRPYVDDTRQGWAALLKVEVQVRARLR